MDVGVIYGQVGSTRFEVAVQDATLRRLDYVAAPHNDHVVLGQVQEVVRKSRLSFEEAMRLEDRDHDVAEDQLSASVHVIGYTDDQGRVQTPRTPFRAGIPVSRADDALVTSVLGLQASAQEGAYLGHVKGSRVPVSVSMNTLAQKHVSVLAKTGAGKSYTVGVILEEFLKAQVPLVILDPHGEYGSLRHANVDDGEISTMRRFSVKPRSFDKQIKEYAVDTRLNPGAERLVLEGMNLDGREIVDLVGGRITGGQVGVLYQAVKEVKDHLPAYTLKDVMDAVQRNKSSAKWNVLNALEALDATGVFDIRGTDASKLVQPAQCTIINLKGVAPDIQEIIVTRITNLLWEARKRNEVPAHILVVEEAHNFCPERGVGAAISGAVLRTVASEGRKFGMGLVIVSQRPAKIDKNVLSQCNTQFVLKITNPNDLKAIVASVEGITSETADELQRLPIGSALVAGGGLTQPVFVDIRPRLTRHGGRSIAVVGEDRAEPVARPSRPVPRETPSRPERRQPPPASPPTSRPGPRSIPSPPVLDDPDLEAEAPPRFRLHGQAHASDALEKQLSREHSLSRAKSAPVRENKETVVAPPRVTAKDAPGIARVATRIGITQDDHAPQQAVDMLRRLAIQNGRDPEQRLGLYAEIARTTCHVEHPACIRCPVKDACEFHANLQTERHKSRSVIRRLWGR